jgi:excinuclease UvrABC nuclease subunit
MPRADVRLLEHKIDADCLAALPRTPGVYIFKGEGALLLYIGKSVDIRSRVALISSRQSEKLVLCCLSLE